jgi:hypothetical protein
MERVLEIEWRSTRSHSVVNSLWMTFWICRKKEYGMNDYLEVSSVSTLFFISFNIQEKIFSKNSINFKLVNSEFHLI